MQTLFSAVLFCGQFDKFGSKIQICACKRMWNLKVFAFHRHITITRFFRRTGILVFRNSLKDFACLLTRADTITCSNPQRTIILWALCLGGGVCRGGWNSRSGGMRRERGLRTEEDSGYRKLDDRLWHLQRCVLGLWAMYNHGGERWLQVHDTAVKLFQSETQPSGRSLF